MARGRKPKPTAILKLTNSSALRKRRHKHVEPKPPPGQANCPAFLDAAGKRTWRTLVKTLGEMGLLSKADRMLMGILCQEWALYWASSKAINLLKQAGAWAEARKVQVIASDARKAAVQACQEFGLTPSARTRIDVPQPGAEQDEFASFLNEMRA